MTRLFSRTPGRTLECLLLSIALWGVSCPGLLRGADSKTGVGTGFLYDPIYLKHQTGAGHPERPERLTAIVDRLEQKGLLQRLVRLKPAAASVEWITTVHTPEYVERVKKSCQAGAPYVDTADAPTSRDSYEVALFAVGGVQAAVDAVMDGTVRNAFCAVRPPGHHALKDKSMGFCLFNNVAIAARYIQKKHKLGKVLIVDWDVHHGNGTQAAFYDDPTVFYFSTHQSPFYPGTGGAEERGVGKGLGFTRNVPLAAGCGDAEYKKAYLEVLKPAAAAFQKRIIHAVPARVQPGTPNARSLRLSTRITEESGASTWLHSPGCSVRKGAVGNRDGFQPRK